MSLEIGERTIGMWSVELGHGNWLAHLALTGDGKLELTYRFRWYNDDLIGRDSKDERNFYHAVLRNTSVPEAIAKLREVFETMRDSAHGRGWELLKGERSIEEFASLLEQMPGIYRQELPA